MPYLLLFNMEGNMKKNIKYFIYFLLFILLGRAEILNGLRPFDIGFFIALIYAGENLAILAPLFIIATFIADPTVDSIVISITSVIMLAGLYFICFKLKKRVNIIEVNIIAFLVRIPLIIINSSDISLLTDTLITLVISQVFTYTAIISIYAIIKRGIHNRMTQDELASSGIFIIAITISLYCIDLWGFMPYYTLIAFSIVMLIYNLGLNGLIIAVLVGTGAAFASGDIAIASAISLCAVTALMFRRMPVAFAAGAYLIADIGAGYFFGAFGNYSLLHFIAVAVGLVAVLFIPPRVHEILREETGSLKKGMAARAVINMNRYELSSEIASIGKAFNDIELTLRKEINSVPSPLTRLDGLKVELARKVCGTCDKRQDCYNEKNGDVADLFGSIIRGAVDKGRATLVDVPPLLTSICKKINTLTQTATDLVKTYEMKMENNKSVDKSKLLLAEQTAGISTLMNGLSKKAGRSIVADESLEDRIVEDLAYRNIVCSEILMWNSEDRGITLIVRHSDKDKKVIEKVLYNRTGICWARSDVKCEHTNGMTAITFNPASEFEILTGECMATKAGSIISGDTRSIIRIGLSKVMVALCDGMGSGEEAESDSNVAMTMIENLYMAGFDSNTILNLVNNLLTNSKDESFSALDIAIVDIENGYVDFIKLGAVNGYIRTEHGVEVVEGGSLPLGIVEEMRPVVHTRKLKTDELCLIISDGVTDTIGIDAVDRILITNSALNPQTISNEIVKACLVHGLKDDITAIAFRIYRRV